MEEDAVDGNSGAMDAAIRTAKKTSRPSKIGEPERRPQKIKDKKGKKMTSRRGGAFDRDLGDKTIRHEGVRAKRGDAIGGMKSKGAKRKAK